MYLNLKEVVEKYKELRKFESKYINYSENIYRKILVILSVFYFVLLSIFNIGAVSIILSPLFAGFTYGFINLSIIVFHSIKSKNYHLSKTLYTTHSQRANQLKAIMIKILKEKRKEEWIENLKSIIEEINSLQELEEDKKALKIELIDQIMLYVSPEVIVNNKEKIINIFENNIDTQTELKMLKSIQNHERIVSIEREKEIKDKKDINKLKEELLNKKITDKKSVVIDI